MKNKGFFKTAAALLAALVLLGGFSVTAYAGGGEDIPTNDSGVIVETEPQPLTPDGNLSLIDDIEGEAAEDKQFIIVQSKNGNYFYIKAAQEDKGGKQGGGCFEKAFILHLRLPPVPCSLYLRRQCRGSVRRKAGR